MAPRAAEQESSANLLHKHQLIFRRGRKGSGHSLSCQSTKSPGSPRLAPIPPRTLPGRDSTDQACRSQNRQGCSCPKPSVNGPHVPFKAGCLQPDACLGLLQPSPGGWVKHN